MFYISHIITLIFCPIVVQGDVSVIDWSKRRCSWELYSFAVELIIRKISFISDLVIEPIKQSMTMHLIVQPVSDVILSVCKPIKPHTVSFQLPIIHSFSCKLVAIMIDNSVLLWDLQIGCEVLWLLFITLWHDCGICIYVWI